MSDELKLIQETITILNKEVSKNKKLLEKVKDKYILERCFKLEKYTGIQYFIPKYKHKYGYYGVSINITKDDYNKPRIIYCIECESYNMLTDKCSKVISYRNLLLEVARHIKRFEDMDIKKYIPNPK